MKIISNKSLIILLLLLFLFTATPTPAQSQNQLKTNPPSKIYGQFLVKLKQSDKIYKINLPETQTENFIAANQNNNLIEYIEPNYTYTASLIPNDHYFIYQNYLAEIKAPEAWDITTGNSYITIAILDTGVDINNPDLAPNIWTNIDDIPGNKMDDDNNGFIDDYNGWDFVINSSDPGPKFGTDYSFLGMNHGTIIAGVASAKGNNNQGITGVNWNARIMPLRVLAGNGTGSTLDVARAVNYAVDNGADIINLSFVGDGESTTLRQAIGRAYQAGVLVVAAAGNETEQGINMDNQPKYPVCHDGPNNENWVIGVASVDANDKLASFSNYGRCIDLVAPGTDIYSTLFKYPLNQQYQLNYGGFWEGTSVSAPQVAAAAALIKSLKPKITLAEIQNTLLNSAVNIDRKNSLYRNQLGRGKLNIHQALLLTENNAIIAEANTERIITSPGLSGGPHIRSFSSTGIYSQFFGFDSSKRFGANASSYDIDQDGLEEIIVSAGTGEQPWVKIFDIKGKLKTEFLAYDQNFTGGVSTAVGDVDNDKQLEIVTMPSTNSQVIVKIFDLNGNLKKQFNAFNSFYNNGGNLAVADINNDNFSEIIIGSGPNTTPIVKIFNSNAQRTSQFIPYQYSQLNGVTVAVGDVDGNGIKEIITGTMSGAKPEVKIFDTNGRLINSFFAYNQGFLGGVNVASGDIDGNGKDEIITGAGPGGGPQVRVFTSIGKVLTQFFAYAENFTGGVKVSSGK